MRDMRRLLSFGQIGALVGLASAYLSSQAVAAPVNNNIEMAARINVAENICDINFGRRLLHFIMLGANEMGVSVESAARMADLRHAEIVRHLNKRGGLDQFCRNARGGRL